jgi:Fe-S oxidoreductase
MLDILKIRQDQVLMESNFPEEVITTFKNLEVNGNPWGMSPQDRELWAEGLDVPRIKDNKDVEYLYWVGCSGAYDARGKEVSKTMAQLLNKAGVSYGILGNEETCTGDSARRIGNEYLFTMMAEQNIDTFNTYGVKKIITQCPHCFTTLKNDYAELGIELQVISHTEFLNDLIKSNKLKPSKALNETITYHDSCYLGRHNGIYDAPREVLSAIPGLEIKEMDRNKNLALCCGAGGGRMWMEETLGDKRINEARVEDVIACNVSQVASACPFCSTMLNDGIGSAGIEDKTKSKDIAQYLFDSLES